MSMSRATTGGGPTRTLRRLRQKLAHDDDLPPRPLLTDTLDPATAHPQEQSPLFSTLPGEIRTRIFSHALAEHADAAQPYAPGSFHYRPGLEAGPRLSLALLQTCRRVYLEVGLLAPAQAERRYWWGRPPPDRPECGDPVPDLQALAPARRALARVRVYVQQFHLEGDLRTLVLLHPRFRPAHLALTLRHGDWWFWERAAPLALDAKVAGKPVAGEARVAHEPFAPHSWGTAVGRIVSLRTFQLELETVRAKSAELDAIVESAKGWVFADPKAPADGRLVCDPATRVSSWEGIDRFYELYNKQQSNRHGNGNGNNDSGNDGNAHNGEGVNGNREVAAGTTSGEGDRKEPEKQPEKLEYYVVELNWKRRMV